MAWLEDKNECVDLSNVIDNNKKAKIYSPNMGLVEFGIKIQISLINNVCKTCHQWVIDNHTDSGQNTLITSLIINIGAEFSIYMKDSWIFH